MVPTVYHTHISDIHKSVNKMGTPWLLTSLCKTYRLPLHSHWQVGLPVVIKATAIAAENSPISNDVIHNCHPYVYTLWQPETHYCYAEALTKLILPGWKITWNSQPLICCNSYVVLTLWLKYDYTRVKWGSDYRLTSFDHLYDGHQRLGGLYVPQR